MVNFQLLLKSMPKFARKYTPCKTGVPYVYAPKYEASVNKYTELIRQEGNVPLTNVRKQAQRLTNSDLNRWHTVFNNKQIEDRFFGIDTDIAYHGSPFNFSRFDSSKIGTGEGLTKRSKGLYLFRNKRFAPFYSNIRSADAPLHLGSTPKLKNPNPTIYKVSGINNLNLKTVSEREAKHISINQTEFMQNNPNIHGLELADGEIVVFPQFIDRLNIAKKYPLKSFIQENKQFPFREWTTDKAKIKEWTS